MRVKILEGFAVRLPRGVFHGGIECELSQSEIDENRAAIDPQSIKQTAPPPIPLPTPEIDLKSKLNAA